MTSDGRRSLCLLAVNQVQVPVLRWIKRYPTQNEPMCGGTGDGLV